MDDDNTVLVKKEYPLYKPTCKARGTFKIEYPSTLNSVIIEAYYNPQDDTWTNPNDLTIMNDVEFFYEVHTIFDLKKHGDKILSDNLAVLQNDMLHMKNGLVELNNEIRGLRKINVDLTTKVHSLEIIIYDKSIKESTVEKTDIEKRNWVY